MSNKTITYFDEIDLDSDDFLSTEITLDDRNVTVDLEFYQKLPEFDWITLYENYISKLDEHKLKVEKAIVKDFKDEETTFEYMEHHLEELDDLTLDKLVNASTIDKTKLEQLISALKLKTIRFHFTEDEFAVWDYSLGNDITDYILVVNTDKNGKVLDFSMNS